MEMDSHDKLVLYIEESYDGVGDMMCYVLYDRSEDSYFICGSRMCDIDLPEQHEPFHFFCKSKKTLLKYIKFIVNADDSRLTYGLFNFNNIFKNVDYIDYHYLNTRRRDVSEVAVYTDMEFDKKTIRDLLEIIKEVVY